MKRRTFLASVGMAATLTRSGWAARGDRPNLLLIQTDEHNFRTLGCYRATLPKEQAFMWGDAVVETPNIDRIANEGALCTRFYATTPVCSPSRGALASGRYPQNTPVTTNNIPMAGDIVTFAEILGKQGYATGYLGKWHLDGDGKPQWAPERKFGFADNRYMFNRGHWKQLEDTPDGPRVKALDAKGQPNYDVKGADEKSFTTDFLCDRTVEFIEAHKDGPFCCWVSIPDPHGPDTVRAPYDTLYAHQTYIKPRTCEKPPESIPNWGPTAEGFQDMAKYYGMVKCIDDNVGKLLRTLEAQGILDNTLVVFTSDHGDLRGEHGRQNKGVPYEGSAKIPFLLRYPARVKAGTLIHEALGCVDFLPTVLALLDAPTAGKEEGRDASALFTTGEAPAGWKDIAFFRSTGAQVGWIAAVTKRYKLVLGPADAPWLMDLEKDPDELTNFAQHPEYREITRELGRQMMAYGKQYGDPFTEDPKIKTDLQWCAEGTGAYVLPTVTKRPRARARSADKE